MELEELINKAVEDHMKPVNEKLEKILLNQQRVEPMIKIFEENKIVKMKVDGFFKTITFYSSEISKFALVALGAWGFLKWAISHIMK